METKYLTKQKLQQAAEILKRGGLVGIPTETVYGLGANGLNEQAVANIFKAKGRPQDNPLILHIPDVGWLDRYCKNIPDSAYKLANAFWPGPLTMILERKPVVPDVVTAGRDTVGMRCPDHILCRKLIAAADVPVAAPSGNLSGRPSPTTAQHMLEDMDGKIDAILEGGSCNVGLESTIVDLTCDPPQLLRPGGITLEQLRDVLGEVEIDSAVLRKMKEGEKPRAPGMQYRHYAPKAPVTVVAGDPEKSAAYIAANMAEGDGVICFEEYLPLFHREPGKMLVMDLGPVRDKEEQARHIFDALRQFDHTDTAAIWAQCPDDTGIGLAIANRLNKAAGFHIIQV